MCVVYKQKNPTEVRTCIIMSRLERIVYLYLLHIQKTIYEEFKALMYVCVVCTFLLPTNNVVDFYNFETL